MIEASDLDALKAELIKGVVEAVRAELKRENRTLLTITEVARKYRRKTDAIRMAVADGLVKCRERKPRNGRKGYLIDAADAERVFGAK